MIEGQEEVGGGAFTTYPPTDPELFRADAMVIGDMGSVRPGVPTLTVALRGMAMVTVEVAHARRPKHSGQFGGAAPDALIALLRALASLHDEQRRRRGRRACGARSGRARRTATRSSASSPRSLTGMPLIGTGGLGSRVWSGPAITVTGIDVPSVDERGQRRRRRTRAPSSTCACTPSRTPLEAQDALVRHLESAAAVRDRARRPRRRDRQRLRGATRPGPAYDGGARGAGGAWGGDAVQRRERRLDPARQRAAARRRPTPRCCSSARPTASRTSTRPNERVLLDEFEKAMVAEADFFGRYAERWGGAA